MLLRMHLMSPEKNTAECWVTIVIAAMVMVKDSFLRFSLLKTKYVFASG